MSKFYVVALTGHSGAGKSLASDYLAQIGVPVIDGDDVAREVVQKGEPCLFELVKEFSTKILNDDGTLNRRKLANICFSTPENKEKLDSITHPFIIKRMSELFDEYHAAGYSYCVVEAAALIESGLYAVCDKTIMVTADEDTLIKRIMERDGITYGEASVRIASQIDESVIRKISDIVITNNGTQQDLFDKVLKVKAQLDICFKD